MGGREVREYTNLTDPKDKKWSGKGKERIDDEEITFQRMVSKMQEVAGERGGYLHGRGALDSDDLLYLKEQMEAEDDAERLLKRTEKRAFAAFKHQAVADTSQAPVPLPLRVEPKLKSGIRQQDILKRLVEVKPKRQKQSDGSGEGNQPSSGDSISDGSRADTESAQEKEEVAPARVKPTGESKQDNPVTSLLLAYQSSDDDED